MGFVLKLSRKSGEESEQTKNRKADQFGALLCSLSLWPRSSFKRNCAGASAAVLGQQKISSAMAFLRSH